VTARTRLIIVEDDSSLRAELVAALQSHGDLEIVAALVAAEPALALIRQGTDIDVALVDLHLPRMSGHDFIAQAKAVRPGLEVVVLTAFCDDESVYEALRVGATGYLMKDATTAEIAAAIGQVRAGGAPMSPSIARRVLASFRARPDGNESTLTQREREVLELLTRGATYALIGEGLLISLSTVQSHIRSIYRKLEVSTKAEATLAAIRRGYVR
jgi:DNA-binding NarL/FixJ family response regulator